MTYQNITTLKLDSLLDFLSKRVDSEGTLIVCQNDSVLNRFKAKGVDIDSVIIEGPFPKAFTIYIRNAEGRPERIICHEFVHLLQMLRGDLSIDKTKSEFVWKGVNYSNSFPYTQRPWEKEAFARQNFWYNEYTKSTRNQRKCIFKLNKK